MMKKSAFEILIASGDAADVEALLHGIGGADRSLVPTYSGKAALEYARQNCPDMILLDVHLPDMDGYEVYQKLKIERMDLPVIFLADASEEAAMIKGLAMGVADYIVRPYRWPEINARIQKQLLLRKKCARDQWLLKAMEAFSTDAVVLLDSKKRVLEILGCKGTYLPLLGKIQAGDNVTEFLPEPLKSRFASMLDKIFRADESFTAEMELAAGKREYRLQLSIFAPAGRVKAKKNAAVRITDRTERYESQRRVDLLLEYQKRSRAFNRLLKKSCDLQWENQQLSSYGIECQRPLFCYVIASSLENGVENTKIGQSIGLWLMEQGYGWIWNTNCGIGVLVQLADAGVSEIEKLANTLKEKLEMHFPALIVKIGIASNEEGRISFKQLYHDAVASLLRSIDNDEACVFLPHNQNGVYEILAQMLEEMDIDRFVKKILGKIICHDQCYKSELLMTLEHFVLLGGIKNVSQCLFIHPNTVLWRKQKIEEILGCDLDEIDVRTEINIAFKLKKINQFLQIHFGGPPLDDADEKAGTSSTR